MSDSNAALKNLNDFWDAASIDEGLIFAVQQQNFALTAAQNPIPIGPTATAPFNVPVPQKVYQAYILTGTQQNDLKIVSAEGYFSHNDLTASSSTPDELYVDYNYSVAAGLIALHLYPVNSGTPTLRLITAATFSAWTLVGAYNIPPGYSDYLAWIVAERSLSTFGAAVAPEIAQNVTLNAKLANDRIRAGNAANRMKPPAAMLEPAQQLTPQPAVK